MVYSICSLVVVLICQFSLTNVKDKKHIVTNKVRSGVFPAINAYRDWSRTIQSVKCVTRTLAMFLVIWDELYKTKVSVLIFLKQGNDKLSGTFEYADNHSSQGVPLLFPLFLTLAGIMLSQTRMLEQILDCVGQNNRPVHAASSSQAISQG